jgi:NitT/TauT family transport system permease protein
MVAATGRFEKAAIVKQIEAIGVPILGSTLVLAVWYAVTDFGGIITEFIFPGPVDVYTNFIEFNSLIVRSATPTFVSIMFGFFAALVLAALLAVTLVWNDELNDGLTPLIVGVNSVPRVSLAPLIIFYIGGVEAKYIIAAWVAFFPMYINIFSGMKNVDDNQLQLMRSLDATYWHEMRYVRIPNALPFIFDGMKVGIVFASVGAVVGEFVGAGGGVGLGNLALAALQSYNLALAFSIVGIMSLFSSGAFVLLLLVQDRVVHWENTSIFPE